MALGDRLKGLTDKAKSAAAERKDKIDDAVEKGAQFADKQTKGKYHDKIEKATAKADTYVDKLDSDDGQKPQEPTPGAEPPSSADAP